MNNTADKWYLLFYYGFYYNIFVVFIDCGWLSYNEFKTQFISTPE